MTGGATTGLDGVRLLGRHGGVVEARILKTAKGTVSGYFDNLEDLAKAVRPWDGKANIYITANPVKPELLGRAHNRLREFAREATGDHEILRRAWFLTDFDPVRPAGISATDAEVQAALSRRNEAVVFCRELGFPEAITAMSGNGGHAGWTVDLPNDDAVTRLFERALKALGSRFTDTLVTVDETVFNAARIWKLYGTLACKGDPLPDRPHRRAALEHVPAEPVLLDREALGRLAAMTPTARTYSVPPSAGHRVGGLQPLDLVGALQARGLYKKPLDRGKHAVTCPWSAEHSGDSGVTETCIFDPRAAGDPWGFDCKHDHCSDRTIKDVLRVLGLAGRDGHEGRATVETPAPDAADGETPPKADAMVPLGIGGGAFLRRTYPPASPIIEGLLSDEGGGWRGGEEKLGKSIEVLDETICLTHALPVLGRFPVPTPRRVLLVSEEDSPRRTWRRLRALLRGHDLDPDDPVVQATLDDRLRVSAWEGFRFDDAGMVARLEATIAEFKPEVVYLDVLRKMTARDLNKADQATAILDLLDDLRRRYGCVFIIVHHYRKSQGFRVGRGSQEIGGSYVLGAWGENSLFFEPIGRSGGVKLEIQVKDMPPSPMLKLVIKAEGPVHDPVCIRLRAEDLAETTVGAQNRDRVLQALRTLDPVPADRGTAGVPVTAIVAALTLSAKSVRSHLRDLEKETLAKLTGHVLTPRPEGKKGATKTPLWVAVTTPTPETPA